MNILCEAFGIREWMSLTDEGRALVVDDYRSAMREDSCDAAEYRRRIGAGNLKSYADCLIAGAKRRANREPAIFGQGRAILR